MAMAMAGACAEDGVPMTDPALLGGWQILADGQVTCEYIFADDGGYTVIHSPSGTRESGTYAADGRRLWLRAAGSTVSSSPWDVEASYYLNDDGFWLGAALPQSQHAGPVGRWQGSYRAFEAVYDGIRRRDWVQENTIELSADHGVTWSFVDVEGPDDYSDTGSGSWWTEPSPAGDLLVWNVRGGTFRASLVDDAALTWDAPWRRAY